jgi:preprotein translocase subunit SecG
MYQVIIVVHVLLGLGVIGLILMQQGKGADAGAAFGSGSSGSVFGAQGAASFLSRTTAILATLFFTTSLSLAVLNGQQSKTKTDLMDNVETEQKAADVPLANKTATPESLPVVPASDMPVVMDKAAPVMPVTAIPVVSSDKPLDSNAKVDEKKEVVAAKPEKSVSSHKDAVATKKATDKSEKKHHSEKKKTTDKSEKKHTADKAEKK